MESTASLSKLGLRQQAHGILGRLFQGREVGVFSTGRMKDTHGDLGGLKMWETLVNYMPFPFSSSSYLLISCPA